MKRIFDNISVFQKTKMAAGVPQRLATMLWVPLITVVLWVVSAIEVVNPLSFISFVKTAIILFVGGFAYHFFIMLIEAPFTEKNKAAWWRIVGFMSSVMLLFLFDGAVVAALIRFQNAFSFLLLLLLFPTTYFVSWHFTMKIQKAYKDVCNKSLQR